MPPLYNVPFILEDAAKQFGLTKNQFVYRYIRTGLIKSYTWNDRLKRVMGEDMNPFLPQDPPQPQLDFAVPAEPEVVPDEPLPAATVSTLAIVSMLESILWGLNAITDYNAYAVKQSDELMDNLREKNDSLVAEIEDLKAELKQKDDAFARVSARRQGFFRRLLNWF